MNTSSHTWYGFEWFGIPVTDWLIALTAIAGTYFAIKGYLRLIRIDTKQQQQIDKQQFENSFLKLIDNHSRLLKSFEMNVPPKAELDNYVSNLQMFTRNYNQAMKLKKIIGFQSFDYNPFQHNLFELELIKKTINDINHITRFIFTKEYFSEADREFYFTTLFNSLYDSEKYLYGYQSALQFKSFQNQHSESINSLFNSYFNALPTDFKLASTDIVNFYPTIGIHLKNGQDQMNMLFSKLHIDRPEIILTNSSPNDVYIGEIFIVQQSKMNDSNEFQIKEKQKATLKAEMNSEFSIDLFDFISHFYFEGKLEALLTQSSDWHQIDETLKNIKRATDNVSLDNFFIMKISITDIKGADFEYFGNLIFFSPNEVLNQYFNIKLLPNIAQRIEQV
jgi:hypothetical protein